MIDLSQVVNDPDFAKEFTIRRYSGQFQKGGWVQSGIDVPGYGIVTVAKEREIESLPEFDRIIGAMIFHSSDPIYITELEFGENQKVSDVIIWHEHEYRIMKVWPWSDFGYYRALGVRMAGQ